MMINLYQISVTCHMLQLIGIMYSNNVNLFSQYPVKKGLIILTEFSAKPWWHGRICEKVVI